MAETERFAYPMTPAYRHGASTPWGGEALRTHFGKDIPDNRTGEALEASTLNDLESKTANGQSLTDIAGGELPLLLKLLDAQDALSVQVHPDDAYANEHEGGKLGKAEAWLILHAEPGAKLVYGLTPGTDVRTLTPETIENHLRWVPVQAGDALNIPAGMVHAIGPGIVLYEIQQTSDVTYRFYDWGRRDAAGNLRALHWDKACAVARSDLQLSPTRGEKRAVQGGHVTAYIETEHFKLRSLSATGDMKLPDCEGFQYLTALSSGALMKGSKSISFSRGKTLYIPRQSSGLILSGPCDVIISEEVCKA